MNIKILLLLFSFVRVLSGQWVEQNSGTSIDLYDICFTDSLNGFALGKSILIHTSDGGKTWDKQNFSTSQNTFYTAYTRINVFNKDIAIFIGDSAIIYYTKNGGKDWLISNTGYPYHYLFSSYLNDSTIFITGTLWNEFYGGGLLLRSTNYGADWEKLYQTKYGVDPIPFWIDDIFFTSIDSGYAIFHISFDNFGPNDFMKTVDGGRSWQKISETPFMVLDLEHKDSVLWARAAGFNYSTDYGLNWLVANVAYWSILDMHIIRNNYGLFLIFENNEDWINNLPKLRFADITSNLFADISLPNGFVAYSFSYIDDRNIWLAGKDGKIFKYNSTVVGIANPRDVYDFSLSQNYPNPFNPTTKIRYTIPTLPTGQAGLPVSSPLVKGGTKEGFITLKVYDILGNEVATLVNEEKSPGSYEVEFPSKGEVTSPLPSGIYFYVLKVGENRISKKMCLIK